MRNRISKEVELSFPFRVKFFLLVDFFKFFVYVLKNKKSEMNKKSQIIGIELNELKELITQTVRTEMESCLKDSRFGIEYKDEVWDRKTAANFLRISPEKVAYLFKKKELPGQMLGREYMFLKSQIIKMFNDKRK
jgi:hypothetical protein